MLDDTNIITLTHSTCPLIIPQLTPTDSIPIPSHVHTPSAPWIAGRGQSTDTSLSRAITIQWPIVSTRRAMIGGWREGDCPVSRATTGYKVRRPVRRVHRHCARLVTVPSLKTIPSRWICHLVFLLRRHSEVSLMSSTNISEDKPMTTPSWSGSSTVHLPHHSPHMRAHKRCHRDVTDLPFLQLPLDSSHSEWYKEETRASEWLSLFFGGC